MRPPTERDQCQAKLDILIDGFMRDDWTAYRDAAAWLRDFADQKNIERGRMMCGGNWFTPQKIEAVRKRARERATRAADFRPGSPRNKHRRAPVSLWSQTMKQAGCSSTDQGSGMDT